MALSIVLLPGPLARLCVSADLLTSSFLLLCRPPPCASFTLSSHICRSGGVQHQPRGPGPLLLHSTYTPLQPAPSLPFSSLLFSSFLFWLPLDCLIAVSQRDFDSQRQPQVLQKATFRLFFFHPKGKKRTACNLKLFR